jgi:hypothetical protein
MVKPAATPFLVELINFGKKVTAGEVIKHRQVDLASSLDQHVGRYNRRLD